MSTEPPFQRRSHLRVRCLCGAAAAREAASRAIVRILHRQLFILSEPKSFGVRAPDKERSPLERGSLIDGMYYYVKHVFGMIVISA